MILLDTHAALWLTLDSRSLGKRSRRLALQAATNGELAISAISFWEIALLVAKRRLRPPDSVTETRRQILASGTIELPLTGEIAILAGELDSLHSDPADRFIAATAIIHNATLISADERLLHWRHSLRRLNAET
ncbi:MAG TPA: type II toxin-antitoxin system VapC family toxin [Xanthobacteraceae bacterium]|nr:type II toxin-antitoxin system VapC family toxin [Xanthobacteraceae bacterium]